MPIVNKDLPKPKRFPCYVISRLAFEMASVDCFPFNYAEHLTYDKSQLALPILAREGFQPNATDRSGFMKMAEAIMSFRSACRREGAILSPEALNVVLELDNTD